jgi:hypothetical protein
LIHAGSGDPLPDRMGPEVPGPRGMPALEFPDRPRVIEARLVEGTAPPLPDLERLKVLDAFPLSPLEDKAGILPVADLAFGQRQTAGGVVKGGHEFR